MANNIDQFLKSKWTGYDFGMDFSTIAGYPSKDWTTQDAYFFLHKELSVTNRREYIQAYRAGRIHHCKPYRNKWLDYTSRREFNTLTEWAAYAGGTLNDILYGTNRVHKTFDKIAGPQIPKYITLQTLLDRLEYDEPMPKQDDLDCFADILAHLDMIDEPLPFQGRKCLVQKPNGTIVIGRVLDQKHYNLEDMESQICVSVPQDTQYVYEAYERLSQMPAGTKVYLRMSDDCFHSTQDLLSK